MVHYHFLLGGSAEIRIVGIVANSVGKLETCMQLDFGVQGGTAEASHRPS